MCGCALFHSIPMIFIYSNPIKGDEDDKCIRIKYDKGLRCEHNNFVNSTQYIVEFDR